jgi:Flp pilus assembly protein TadB
MRNGSVRASDADRESVAGRLRDHAVAGRLTPEELDERSGEAFAARTLGELDTLLADLPRDGRRGPAPAKAAMLLLAEGVLCVLVGVIIVTIAILWVLVRAGVQLARLAAARRRDRRCVASVG